MTILGKLGRLHWVFLALGLLPLLLLLAPVADCFCRDRWIVSEAPIADVFEALPGRLGVTLTERYQPENQSEIRRFQFQGGNVLRVESLPSAAEQPRGLPSAIELLERIANLPIEPPYAVSGDGRFAAVRATDEEALYRYHLEHWFARPHDLSILVIVDLQARREVARVDGGSRWRLEGLRWSPDGKYVAALRMEAGWGLCLREAYYYAHDFPIHLLSYYLDVYDVDGRLIASEKLLSRSRQWFSGEIVWTE